MHDDDEGWYSIRVFSEIQGHVAEFTFEVVLHADPCMKTIISGDAPPDITFTLASVPATTRL
jgi:hypothetical protein